MQPDHSDLMVNVYVRQELNDLGSNPTAAGWEKKYKEIKKKSDQNK